MIEKKTLISFSIRSGLRIAGLLAYLPFNWAGAIGSGIGWAVSLFCPRDVEIASRQIAFARRTRPELGGSRSARMIARNSFAHVGRSIAETFFFPLLLRRDENSSTLRYITSDGDLAPIWARGRAVCAISGHIGNFELLLAYHAATGPKPTVVGREPAFPELAHFADQLRNVVGAESVWRDGRKAAAAMIRASREKRAIALLIDQDTNLESAYAPFFGLDAASPSAALQFAVREQLSVIATFIVREAPLRYRVVNRDVPYDPQDPRAVENILTQYNRHLEELIVKYPKQWLWWHRRWRHRPENPSVPRWREYLEWLDTQTPVAC